MRSRPVGAPTVTALATGTVSRAWLAVGTGTKTVFGPSPTAAGTNSLDQRPIL